MSEVTTGNLDIPTVVGEAQTGADVVVPESEELTFIEVIKVGDLSLGDLLDQLEPYVGEKVADATDAATQSVKDLYSQVVAGGRQHVEDAQTAAEEHRLAGERAGAAIVADAQDAADLHMQGAKTAADQLRSTVAEVAQDVKATVQATVNGAKGEVEAAGLLQQHISMLPINA